MDRIILVQEEPRGPSQLIEIIIDTNGDFKVPLPNLATLRNDTNQRIIIKELRLVTADVLTNAPISGEVNAPAAELQKISLVLYSQGWNKAVNMPILDLNSTTFAGSVFPHRYNATKFDNWERVDWEQSYMLYSNGTTGVAGAPYAVLIDVHYLKLNAQGEIVNGLS